MDRAMHGFEVSLKVLSIQASAPSIPTRENIV